MQKNFFLIQTIQYISLYVIFQFWDNSVWWQNKEKEIIFLVVSYAVYMLISTFIWFFRPIIIEINQTNTIGPGIEQTVVLQRGQAIDTHYSLRTIRVDLKITRRQSLWWKILLKILSKKDLEVLIEPFPKGIVIQSKDTLSPEVEITETGFIIRLNELLKELYTFSGRFSIEKSYPYILTDHEEIVIVDNIAATVQPRILLKNKPIKLLSLLIKFQSVKHNIRYYSKEE